MTRQIPDSCTFDGRKWEIVDWEGDSDCIPPNESLGIVTCSPGTNNWSGPMNHFLVHRDQLFLFKVEVSLDPSNKGILPFGARREIVRRYPVMENHTNDGMRLVEHCVESEFFVFDDLKIAFTGQIILTFPYFDEWNLPWPIEDCDFYSTRMAELHFENGQLVDVIERVMDSEEQ